MKKLLIVALAAVFYLALELSAMAKVEVGGEVTLDWTYISLDPECAQWYIWGDPAGTPPTSDGFESMNFITPFLNRLFVRYTSDDGALVGFIELAGGESLFYDEVEFWYAYVQWQITPTNRITFGKQTTNFARFWPNQWVGYPLTTLWGIQFGNINHATTRTGIKGYWRISDMFGLVWGLWDTRLDLPGLGPIFFILPGGRPPPAWLFAEAENKLPRIDLALPIRFPWGRIEPSATWSRFEYDQLPWEGDASYNIWGFSLGTDASFRMFSFGAEITWGENLGGGNYRGAEGARPAFYVDSSGNTNVADAETIAWFVDVGFRFGSNKINVMYGQKDTENDGDPSVPRASDPFDFKLKMSFYGISWRIDVAKGFIIRPELMFYEWGNDTTAYGKTFNRGKTWLLGLQFNLIF